MLNWNSVKISDLIWLGQRLADTGRAEIQAQAPEVPTAELIVMGHLLDGPPSTITALTARSGYAQSRVSTAVSSLVARGWAQTRSDPADGRRTLVFVPDDVRAPAEEARMSSEARTLDQLLSGLPVDRRERIVAALEELLGVLRGAPAQEPPGPGDAHQSRSADRPRRRGTAPLGR